jgi:hypothetical protein
MTGPPPAGRERFINAANFDLIDQWQGPDRRPKTTIGGLAD